MLALLKLIPFKDWIYGSIIVGLLIGFGWYTHHERQVGAAKLQAAVTQVASRAEAAVVAANTAAQTAETQSAKTYIKVVTAPAPRNIGLVCHRSGPGSGAVPEAHAVAGTGPGKPAADGGSAATFDPSGAALEVGAKADAQIAYLQARVHQLEAQMDHSP